jgi:hypothetical protein
MIHLYICDTFYFVKDLPTYLSDEWRKQFEYYHANAVIVGRRRY